MSCNLVCCSLSAETTEAIRASVEAGRGKSMFPVDPDEPMPMFGAMCRCGVGRKPAGLAKHVEDDGMCTVHPGRPMEWVQGAGPKKEES